MFILFDRIRECDGQSQTDGQTLHDGIGRLMQSIARQKLIKNK